MKSPHPFKAFSFIFSSNFVHMVYLTTSASATLSPAYCVYLPSNEGPRCPGSVLQYVLDWLLYLGIFGGRRGLEYLVLSLFTHIGSRQ